MPGKVITFYSYKGGVGRSQALANVAVSLANRGKRVIAVDMDLESPGIHSFFQPIGRPTAFLEEDLADQDGLLEHLIACSRIPERRPDGRALLRPCAHRRLVAGSVRLLPAGRLDADYSARLQHFSWASFYEQAHGADYIDQLRSDLLEEADYVLIDSRTGMTDASYVGTYQLAEIVVVLFALHRQGIGGAARIARGIRACQEEEGARARPRRTLLVASRVDEAGEEEALQEWIDRARSELSGLSDDLLIAPEDRLPYMAAAAFGERIVVGGAASTHLPLAYERLVHRLLEDPADTSPSRHVESFRSPSELFSPTRLLVERAENLANEISAMRPAAMSLRGLVAWAHDIARDRSEIEAQTQRIWTELQQLIVSKLRRAPAPAEDVSSLRALSSEIQVFVRDAAVKWTRTKLSPLSGGDDGLLERACALSSAAIDQLDAAGFDAALVQAERLLEEEGIDALLMNNALELDRLRRVFDDDGAANTWLEGKLQQLLGGPDFDVARCQELHNLLRLLVRTISRAEPHHWLAYDNLCLFYSEDDAKQRAAFQDVGVNLWQREWELSLSAPAPQDTKSRPEALEALKHLIDSPGARALVEWLESKIVARAKEGASFGALFRVLHRDPLLIASIDRIAASPSEHRQALLGSWLQVVGPKQASLSAASSFIEALVEGGFAAEAHYAVEVLSHDRSDLEDTRPATLAALGTLLRAIERDRSDAVMTLLSDDRTVGQLLASRVGKALVATYMTNLVALPGSSVSFATTLSRHAAMDSGPPLPASVLECPWSPDAPCAMKTSERFHRLKQEIVTLARKRFFNARTTAVVYEQSFQDWVERRLAALETSTAPPETDALDLRRLDAEQWVDKTFHEQRARIPGLREPEGITLDNMVRAFNAVRDLLLELNNLRPLDGSPSLLSLADQGLRVGSARRDLRAWMTEGRHEAPTWIFDAADHLLRGDEA